ncbi:MAG: DUF3421 domain-containing protein, partial [Bryobacterales bacterium]|nr:DUF3421 domain-containing protein [Bryobacterales bacterium]
MLRYTLIAAMAAAMGVPAAGQTWVNGTGTVPALAVRAGTDLGGAALYVCRTTDSQALVHVGKFRQGLGCVYFYNGVASAGASYQILTDFSDAWQSATSGSAPGNSTQVSSGLYVCRALVESSMQVGQLRSGSSGCAIEFGGTGGVFSNYEVLWTPWADASNGAIPGGAVPTGNDTGGTLYTCRAVISGATQIGKLRSGFTGCRIGLNGSITVATNYQVLVNLTAQWQSYNTAVPAGGAFYAGSSAGAPKYICRFTIGGTSDLTPGQVGGPASENPSQCKVEYFNASKNAGNYEAFRLVDPAFFCAYSVSPASIDAPGGGSTVTVNVSGGCGWVNFPSESWVKPSVRSGTGGSFTVTIDPNPLSTSRTATLSVGGTTIPITQSGSCTWTVSPTSISQPASGGIALVSVTTNGCPFFVSETLSWVDASLIGTTNNRTVQLTIAPNSSTNSRSGNVDIAGQLVNITQAGVCSYTVSP